MLLRKVARLGKQNREKEKRLLRSNQGQQANAVSSSESNNAEADLPPCTCEGYNGNTSSSTEMDSTDTAGCREGDNTDYPITLI